ncbi:Class E vacuolar protein-sorting machinery protein HSE1 [Nakaseomyces bracarensis]|uniref:Class E vacuolar protein-sorting machinery protein HSE1 n=1 Tax=Nakaseomyces bracarensis TaxID=273131 RepID=A0ABR4NN14_9SACH
MGSLEVKLRKAVLAATDAKLRSDNWQYIIDVCDLVKVDPEDASVVVMELIEKRLVQADANVILRSLSLVVALAENCGSRLKQSVSSKHFTGVLYGLIDDSNVHITVKKEIAKVVKQLADSFESDPSLKAMADLNSRIRRKWPHLLEQPEKPSKQRVMATQDTTQEDEELQQALKMSLQEYEKQKEISEQQQQQQQQQPSQQPSQQQLQQQQQQASTMKRVRALYDLNTSEADELSFKKGDVIIVLEQVYRDWWRGSLRGQIGIFPLNYVTPIAEPSTQEIEKDIERENQVFSQVDNVNTLNARMKIAQREGLAGLNQDPVFNELYGSVTPLRPQITKLIGKYSKEKDDALALRQVLVNAESTYNQLLDKAARSYSAPAPAPPQTTPQTTPQYTPTTNYGMQPQQQQEQNHLYSNAYPSIAHPVSSNQTQIPEQYHQQPPQYTQANYQHPGLNTNLDGQYNSRPNY